MKIQINDHRKIFSIQEEFNKLFPHLKIEFLKKPSNIGSQASEKVAKSSNTLGDCRIIHTKGELTLSPSMTTSDLKQALSDTYGLSVVVFRRSGQQWVEMGDNVALETQDTHAARTGLAQ